MSGPNSLQSLVQILVPASRADDDLRRELREHCSEILNRCACLDLANITPTHLKCAGLSNIGQTKESDITHLGSLMKRQRLSALDLR